MKRTSKAATGGALIKISQISQENAYVEASI